MSHSFRHAIALLVFVFSLIFRTGLVAEQRPNFLIIMADDCTYNDLPVYGGKNALTPNIDRLASQGLGVAIQSPSFVVNLVPGS